MPARTCWLLAFAVQTAALPVGASKPVPKAPADLEAAKAAWQRRHEKVRSIRVTLTEEATTHRAYYLLAPARGKEKPTAPDKDIHVTFASTVTIKGDEFKYSYTGQEWSRYTRNLKPVSYTAISNPDARSYFTDHPGSDRYPTASKTRRTISDETSLTLVPLMLAVRSGQPYHRKLSDYTPTGKMVPVEGRDCVEIFRGSRAEKQSEYMYLDPDRDWVIRRIDGFSDGKLAKRISVEYAPNPDVGWLPSSWSYVTRMNDGTPLSGGQVAIGRYEVNVEISDDEFRLQYPSGTFVVDDTKGAGKETVSVVKGDGSPGVAIPLSEQPTYKQLEQANQSVRRQWIWLAIIGGGIVILLGAVAANRWHRRKAQASP